MDGEFWHGQNWEERKSRLKAQSGILDSKIEENIARDIRDDKDLRAKDWYPIHFWEKEILKDTDECIETIQELAEQQIERSIDCRNE